MLNQPSCDSLPQMRSLLCNLLDAEQFDKAKYLLRMGADLRASWVETAHTGGKALPRLLELRADPNLAIRHDVRSEIAQEFADVLSVREALNCELWEPFRPHLQAAGPRAAIDQLALSWRVKAGGGHGMAGDKDQRPSFWMDSKPQADWQNSQASLEALLKHGADPDGRSKEVKRSPPPCDLWMSISR